MRSLQYLQEFLHAVEMHPKVLMSDDADQFYTAWHKVFGNVNQSFCACGM